MELYGSLLLYRAITANRADADIAMNISLNTDNRGNAYQATDQKAKNNTAADMLMELALLKHDNRCRLRLRHVYREHNEWADQLTHADSSGFDDDLRITPDEISWHIFDQLQSTRTHTHRERGAPRPPTQA